MNGEIRMFWAPRKVFGTNMDRRTIRVGLLKITTDACAGRVHQYSVQYN